jgi:hypothetical protein
MVTAKGDVEGQQEIQDHGEGRGMIMTVSTVITPTTASTSLPGKIPDFHARCFLFHRRSLNARAPLFGLRSAVKQDHAGGGFIRLNGESPPYGRTLKHDRAAFSPERLWRSPHIANEPPFKRYT